MFSITVVFGSPATPATLLYHTKEAAELAWNSPQPGNMLTYKDDFGQIVSVRETSFHGALFEDMEKSALTHVERSLHQMRTQIKANSAGKADPAIAAHLRSMGQGPAVLSPGMNGGMRGY